VVALLLANKAEVNTKNYAGWTPLYAAMFAGHKDGAEMLRQHRGHDWSTDSCSRVDIQMSPFSRRAAFRPS